jgi:hypothetical protein
VSTPTVLPAAALSGLVPAPSSPGMRRSTLARLALYLALVPVPLAVAVIAGEPLTRLPWELLVAAWCAGSVRPARHLLTVGTGLAASVALVGMTAGHEVAPAYGVPPALVPLLFAIPLLEVWIWWHLSRVTAGLVRYDDRVGHLRYVRSLGWTTLAALLPPLAAGAALAGTATRLPYGLSAHPDAPALVVAMACGVLLVGVVAIGRLLSARRRPGLAAAVAWCPVVGALGLHWGAPLPGIAIALAVACAAGLVLAAYVLFDSRSPLSDSRNPLSDSRNPLSDSRSPR